MRSNKELEHFGLYDQAENALGTTNAKSSSGNKHANTPVKLPVKIKPQGVLDPKNQGGYRRISPYGSTTTARNA